MNEFVFDGSWNQIKGKLRQKFAQVTEEDLEYAKGKGEETLGRLENRLGFGRVELEMTLNNIKASLPQGNPALEALDRVKAKTAKLGNQLQEKASIFVGDVAAKASVKAAEALSRQAIEQAYRGARNLNDTSEERIRRNPRMALFTALLAGFGFGMLRRL